MDLKINFITHCNQLYRPTSIITIGDTKLLPILLLASIQQVTTCTRKLHIVMHMNVRYFSLKVAYFFEENSFSKSYQTGDLSEV